MEWDGRGAGWRREGGTEADGYTVFPRPKPHHGHGLLALDSAVAERAQKRVAPDRRNWLFAGNDEAAANRAGPGP